MSDAIMRLRRSLADKVGSIGWRKALEAVPRELFLGAAVYRADPDRGDLWTPARRAEVGMEEWLSLAYSDQTWVTQVEGMLAEDAAGIVAGSPSSSSTFPSLVVLMLEAAQIGEDDKVLEIGTGTGYSTALLAERLGSGTVTSVESSVTSTTPGRPALSSGAGGVTCGRIGLSAQSWKVWLAP